MTELGAFFWYSIPQQAVSLERARRAWRAAQLDVAYLPESRKPEHVAAEACSTVDRSTTGPSFLQIENTKTRLLYEVRTPRGDVELVFTKATGEFACLDEEVLRRVRAVYERNGSRLPAHKQRSALRTFLLDAGAENLHGSIYFMPTGMKRDGHTGLELLAYAAGMVIELYGEESNFHRIFVERDPLQTAYIGDAVDRVLLHEIGDLTVEVRHMLDAEKPRKWRKDKIDALVYRKVRLERRVDRWEALLPDRPPAAAMDVLTLMDDAVNELVVKTEAPLIV